MPKATKTCNVPGCGNTKIIGRGLCSKHYGRATRGPKSIGYDEAREWADPPFERETPAAPATGPAAEGGAACGFASSDESAPGPEAKADEVDPVALEYVADQAETPDPAAGRFRNRGPDAGTQAADVPHETHVERIRLTVAKVVSELGLRVSNDEEAGETIFATRDGGREIMLDGGGYLRVVKRTVGPLLEL